MRVGSRGPKVALEVVGGARTLPLGCLMGAYHSGVCFDACERQVSPHETPPSEVQRLPAPLELRWYAPSEMATAARIA